MMLIKPNSKFISVAVITLMLFRCGMNHSEIKSLEGTSPEFQKYIYKEFAQGKKLYKTHCSTCHGIYGKGKDSITQFDTAQLHNYSLNYIRGDYRNHAFTQFVEASELEQIMLFLTYKANNKQ